MRRGDPLHHKNVCLLLVVRNQRIHNSLNRLVTTDVFLQITFSITAEARELRSFLIIVTIEFNRSMRWTRHDQSTAECNRATAHPRSHSGTPMSNCAQTYKRNDNYDPCDEYRITVKRMSYIGVVKPGDHKITACK